MVLSSPCSSARARWSLVASLLACCLLPALSSTADARTSPSATQRAAPKATSQPLRAMTLIQQTRQRQQVQRVSEVMRRVSARLEPELRRLPQASAMSRAIEQIARTTNPAVRQRLVADYQRRYRRAYEGAMAKAKVRPQDFLRQARAQGPDLQVRSADGISVLIVSTALSGFSADEQPASQPLSVLQTIADFLEEESISSGAGAGGQVEFDVDGVRVSSSAIVAGQVRAAGSLSKRIDVPADAQSATLRISGESEVDSLAVGVVGIAVSTCINELAIGPVDDSDSRSTLLYVRQDTMAPLLWVSSNSERLEFDQSVTLAAGESVSFEADVSCLSSAIASPTTNATAALSGLSVELGYQQ